MIRSKSFIVRHNQLHGDLPSSFYGDLTVEHDLSLGKKIKNHKNIITTYTNT